MLPGTLANCCIVDATGTTQEYPEGVSYTIGGSRVRFYLGLGALTWSLAIGAVADGDKSALVPITLRKAVMRGGTKHTHVHRLLFQKIRGGCLSGPTQGKCPTQGLPQMVLRLPIVVVTLVVAPPNVGFLKGGEGGDV